MYKTSNTLLNLMAGRLGYISTPEPQESTISGINQMNTRLSYNTQLERMIKDKKKSLTRALLYSYQSAFVKKVDDTTDQPPVRALINPNKLSLDYDDKVISIGFEHNFKVGDVFKWEGTNTYWLIYLQDLNEVAYFRGEIRKCSFEIEIDGHKTYAALKGPDQKTISSSQIHGISIDKPNYSLYFLVPKTEENLNSFQRYKKFYLQGDKICWRIEGVDIYSSDGVIEVNAKEYYANEFNDDIEKGIVDGKVIPIEDPNPPEIKNIIEGETFIKPKQTHSYTFIGEINANWSYDTKLPLDVTIEDKTITVMWTSNYSGQFTLKYGDFEKIIVVESLF